MSSNGCHCLSTGDPDRRSTLTTALVPAPEIDCEMESKHAACAFQRSSSLACAGYRPTLLVGLPESKHGTKP
eukprot:7460474-Pyramimonas_sp.AAC.1